MGSQLKKIRRALPPPPSQPNLHVAVGREQYRFHGYPPPTPKEVTIVELSANSPTVPPPSHPSAPPEPMLIRRNERPSIRSLLPLLALAALGTGMANGGRHRG